MIDDKRVSGRAAARAQQASVSVAIDLGYNAVRVVEVAIEAADDGARGARIVRRGSASLPPGFWSDVAAHTEAGASALRNALSTAGITAKKVSACLPRRLVTVRFARLPHAPPEQMKALVAFEAQQYILFPLEEVVLDYKIMADGATGQTGLATLSDDLETVMLAAARRSVVADVMAVFDRAGLELSQLSVSALALAEHLNATIEPTAIIDIEPGEMDITIVSDGRLLFTRASALEPDRGRPEISARQLAEEVARSLTAYQNEQRQHVLAHVFLTGASATGTDQASLERLLSETIDMPVTRLQNRLLPPTDLDSGSYATAAGLAMQSIGSSLAAVNLVPDERAQRKAVRAKKQRQNAAIFLGALLVIAGIYGGDMYLKKTKADHADMVAANDALQTFNAALKSEQKTHDTLVALDGEVEKGLDTAHPSVDILVAINRALPTGASLWLTSLIFERGGLITIHGETKSAAAATDLVIALQASGAFIDVRLGDLSDALDDSSSLVSASAPKAATADTATLPAMGGDTTAVVPSTAPAATNPPAGTPAAGNPPGRGSGPPPDTGFGFGFGSQSGGGNPDSTPRQNRRRGNRNTNGGNNGANTDTTNAASAADGAYRITAGGPGNSTPFFDPQTVVQVDGNPIRMSVDPTGRGVTIIRPGGDSLGASTVPPGGSSGVVVGGSRMSRNPVRTNVAPAPRRAPVPPPTVTPSAPATTSQLGAANGDKHSDLTSFTITCRINPGASSLIPVSGDTAQAPASSVMHSAKHAALPPASRPVRNGVNRANP